ncbi:hypothetical protein [uncultured Megamonas sp.]|uniref:hypothetical protein n=1 Tax=uncultured Megamonas sp. TaxID=286140 RepID=UPI00259B6A1D|nr:hypothetical protein [uncultured Megamonas sp.]
MKSYTEQEMKAINKAVKEAGFEAEVIETLINYDYVTINKGRDGRMYAYYFDGVREAIVDVDTLNIISNYEAEALFC